MHKTKIIGIASLPERKECLKDTIDSLYDQADKIIVALNNYEEVPSFLKRDKIEYYLLDNSLGDAAKFYKVQEFKNSYYLSCDDDIIYPSNYIEYMVSKTDEYGVPVGLHGAILHQPIKSMYKNRTVYHCLSDVDSDIKVDYIGTGVLCYDTSKLYVSIKDFRYPNMADIWFGDIMNKYNIKPFVLKHKSGYLTYNKKMIDDKIGTIYSEFIRTKNDKIQTELVSRWNIK